MPKKQTFGKNWWAQRWIAVLESFGWASRLQRGRSYARSGHVLDLTITPGKVAARVQGSRAQPYRVSIALAPLSPQDWELATAAMAGQAVYAARLLAGEMPAEIEDAFAAARVPLFPRTGRDLTTACSCPDWANPCKHVAAVYYRLGQEFDADPFLLFRLRGRERESVLADLRARRSAAALGGASAEAAGPRPDLAAAQGHFWAAAGGAWGGPRGGGGRQPRPPPAPGGGGGPRRRGGCFVFSPAPRRQRCASGWNHRRCRALCCAAWAPRQVWWMQPPF